MPAGRWVGFALVWLALVMFTVEAVNHRRRQLRLAVEAYRRLTRPVAVHTLGRQPARVVVHSRRTVLTCAA